MCMHRFSAIYPLSRFSHQYGVWGLSNGGNSIQCQSVRREQQAVVSKDNQSIVIIKEKASISQVPWELTLC